MALIRKKQVDRRAASTSPGHNVPTYSYHNVRNDQNNDSGRNTGKKTGAEHHGSARKLWIEKFGLIILAIAVIVCLVSILYLSSSPVVILQQDDDNPIFSSYKSSIAQEANKLLSSSILNKNKITVNTSKIESTLETDYPMYGGISISLPFISHHPVLYLTPAQPVVTLNNSAGTYLINQSGSIMASSSTKNAYSSLKLPILNYPVSGYINIGQKILTNQEVQFIQTISYELSLKGNQIAYMNLLQNSPELDVYLKDKPYYVKFNFENNDPRQQAGSFLATQHYLATQNITPSQYIDVTTDGRVYYQ